jgi:heme/copper-type cytochrome/quinol oxidase subunit 2
MGVDLLRLLSGLSGQKAATALLSWKQGKLLGATPGPLGVGSSLLIPTLSRADTVGELRSLIGSLPRTSVRSGYTPIQPGVGNMRRLRVTQGIYLPADLPIHGIFGSKDVIHSWAIPGLGVKIDCIPGYSSHRRLFFR